MIEELLWNGYEIGVNDNVCWSIIFNVKSTGWKHFALSTRMAQMKELKWWIEIGTHYDHRERKHIPPLPRYSGLFIDTTTRSKIANHYLSSDISHFLHFFKTFLEKCSKKCQKILQCFNKRELILLRRQVQNLQHNNFQKNKKNG